MTQTYFDDEKLRTALLTNSSRVLRDCQSGALLSVIGHFTASKDPAIVSLPTGAGKTELMFAIAFCLQVGSLNRQRQANRILIVEPSRFLRQQTAVRLRELRVFRDYKLIETDFPACSAAESKSVRDSKSSWDEFKAFDAVIATPKTISPAEASVVSPPEDLFDLVFIDEAHHAAAKTWKAIIKAFPKAKIVLFTATAFRRDQRRLPGRLVYHYPIGRALDSEIYRPIEFQSVKMTDPDNIDRDIAKSVATLFAKERKTNPSAAIIIRTDRIAKCQPLCDLYGTLKIAAIEIHSELSTDETNKRLDQLRAGTVDAVVTVGMMAEGIDVPGLKIAALHSPPKSLPYTLQIVGRVSRTNSTQSGNAWLVASPETLLGEARKLFREDRDWMRFIPSLVEQAMKAAHGAHADIILKDSSRSPILAELLEPFFSVQILEFKLNTGNIHENLFQHDLDLISGIPRVVESIELLASTHKGCVSLITRSITSPLWGVESGLIDSGHDLHIFYTPPRSKLLFIATTSPQILKPIRNAHVGGAKFIDDTIQINPQRIQEALSDTVGNDYSVVGLENALGTTGTHSSYRMHLGSGSGTSIRPSDGSVYGPGHAMGRTISNTLRGVAVKNRRVWEMRREKLGDFLKWCNEISSQIKTVGNGLPGLSFLAQPVPATELFTTNENPIAIVPSDRLFLQDPSSISAVDSLGEQTTGNIVPTFTFETKLPDGSLPVKMKFNLTCEPIELSYSATDSTYQWRVHDSRKPYITDVRTGQRQPMQAFLNENSPILIMPNGGAIRGNYGWKILQKLPELPKEIFTRLNWDDTDITKESRAGSSGLLNVQQKATLELESRYPDAIIIVDDGAYEIADLIVINSKQKVITFVHCKFTKNTKAGNRVTDWYELYAQCCRSHSWIRALHH